MTKRSNHNAAGRAPPGALVGSAIVRFEQGEMRLELVRRKGRFVWRHGRKPFGPPLASRAAAVKFLRKLCELYNYTLKLEEPPEKE